MIDATTAAEQLERLTGLNFYPQTAAAKKELRLVLEQAATSEIAKNTVTDWLNESTDCPKPAQLRAMIFERNASFALAEQSKYRPEVVVYRCLTCEDTGIKESTHVDDLHSVASWCDCQQGMDRRRHAPHWTLTVNQARFKLLRLFGDGTSPISRIQKLAQMKSL